MLQFGAVPTSLEASVAASTLQTEQGYSRFVVDYTVDCAATASPENDACRSLSIYPAEVYHTQGSVWGGTITARLQEKTTTRKCEFGSYDSDEDSVGGRCSQTIVSDSSTVTETTTLDKCYVYQHSVPLLITAGVDKLDDEGYKATEGVSELLSYYYDDLMELGCSSRPVLRADVTTTDSRTTVSDTRVSTSAATISGTNMPTTGATATQDQPTSTGTSSPDASTTYSARTSTVLGAAQILTGLGHAVLHLLLR